MSSIIISETGIDVEWALDGSDNLLYIIQTRPETIHSNKENNILIQYKLKEKGDILLKGVPVGEKISSGSIKKLNNVEDPESPGIAQGFISGGVGNTVQTHKVGYAQFSYLVYEQVYDESGVPLEGVYVDQNGDGIINDSDKRIYKNPNPDYLLGFSSYYNSVLHYQCFHDIYSLSCT